MMLLRSFLLGILLCGGLAACGNNTNSGGLRVSGDLLVNGAGLSGSIQVNSERVYALRHLVAGGNYTVRTQIAEGGTLSGSIYETMQDYLNSGPTFTALVSHPTYTYIYEVNFTAPSSGDYFLSLTGVPNSDIIFQYFYDLRLLSSSATTSLVSAPSPSVTAGNTTTILQNYVHIYSGTTVTPPGTYTVSLTSRSTTTLGNPQMYIYADPSLTIDSLLYSSYTTSTAYMITTFATATTVPSSVNEIPGVPFSATGPYIMIKGNTSIQYTLSVH